MHSVRICVYMSWKLNLSRLAREDPRSPNDAPSWKVKTLAWLVGGWTHLKNMLVKLFSSSPISGVKIENIWNHHLVEDLISWLQTKQIIIWLLVGLTLGRFVQDDDQANCFLLASFLHAHSSNFPASCRIPYETCLPNINIGSAASGLDSSLKWLQETSPEITRMHRIHFCHLSSPRIQNFPGVLQNPSFFRQKPRAVWEEVAQDLPCRWSVGWSKSGGNRSKLQTTRYEGFCW